MEVMHRLCDEDERIHNDPAVFIAVSELADSSVNFAVRAWVKSEDYRCVCFDVNKKIYKVFTKEGLNIPLSANGRACPQGLNAAVLVSESRSEKLKSST